MKNLMVALVLCLAPAALNAQQMIQPSPMDTNDPRLAVIQPIAERIVAGDVDGAQKAAEAHLDQALKSAFASQLKQVAEAFKGQQINGYMNGRGRNVLVTTRKEADGASSGFVFTLDPESNRITGVVQVMVQLGGG